MSVDVPKGHLTPGRGSIERFPVPGDLASRVRGVWVPRWALPSGESVTQHMIEHPGGNLVVEPGEARYHRPAPHMSTKVLVGAGWAVGLLLTPAGAEGLTRGQLLPGTSEFAAASARIRALMARPGREEEAAQVLLAWAAEHVPEPSADGRLLSAVVDRIEADPSLVRASELCSAFDIDARRLERLVKRVLGFSPKWLIRRRRLQDAAALLREGRESSHVAAELGYADQAHFIRDFRAVTGVTPGAYLRMLPGP